MTNSNSQQITITAGLDTILVPDGNTNSIVITTNVSSKAKDNKSKFIPKNGEAVLYPDKNGTWQHGIAKFTLRKGTTYVDHASLTTPEFLEMEIATCQLRPFKAEDAGRLRNKPQGAANPRQTPVRKDATRTNYLPNNQPKGKQTQQRCEAQRNDQIHKRRP